MMFEATLQAPVEIYADDARQAIADAIDNCETSFADYRFSLAGLKPTDCPATRKACDAAFSVDHPVEADGDTVVTVTVRIAFDAPDEATARLTATAMPYRITILEAAAEAARKAGLPPPLSEGPANMVIQPGCDAKNVHAYNRTLSAETGRVAKITLRGGPDGPYAELSTGAPPALAEIALRGVLASDPAVQAMRAEGPAQFLFDETTVRSPSWAAHGLADETQASVREMLIAFADSLSREGRIAHTSMPGRPPSATARAATLESDARSMREDLEAALVISKMAGAKLDAARLRANLEAALAAR